MAAAASVSITGVVTDTPVGDKAIGPITTTSAAAAAVETQTILAAGANVITVPALATICIIVFDSTSATTKTLKGVAGDTGILLKSAGAAMLTFTAAAVASFVINSSALDTGLYTTFLFI